MRRRDLCHLCGSRVPAFSVPVSRFIDAQSSRPHALVSARTGLRQQLSSSTSGLTRKQRHKRYHIQFTSSLQRPNSATNRSGLSNESAKTHGRPQTDRSCSHKPNYLILETSRYLADSAYDVVCWYPWGHQAFLAARSSQKPILLSSGFLSCHMCDVMSEHFRDPDIARILNERFICVKVDREERPDVDSVYNSFVQAVTGRTGWPLTCFLTPSLIPFVGTTYLPKDRLMNAVKSIAERWEINRDKVEDDGKKVVGALRDLFARRKIASQQHVNIETLHHAFDAAVASFDVENGGFGSAPKFPRPSVFEFLLSVYQSNQLDSRVRCEALDMVLDSLRCIASGGIHDHVGGGFFRYALDASWQVPHFEKILSDQVQLAMTFLHAYQLSGEQQFRDVVCKTLDFVKREMRDNDTGAIYSAIHADSRPLYDITKTAAEGAFYTFSSFELMLILGEPASTIFQKRFGVTAAGNVSESAVAKAEYNGLEGLNVLRITSSIPQIADEVNLSEAEVGNILHTSLAKVLEERERRPRPPTDDLSVTSWMALAISAFVRAGRSLNRPDYVAIAEKAAGLIRRSMVIRLDDEADAVYLARAYRGKRGIIEAFADDYTYCIQAFLDCYEVSGDLEYVHFARQLQNALDTRFLEQDGYCNAVKGDDDILLRRVEDYDGAEPAASSVAVLNLVRMASLFGDNKLWNRAKGIMNSFKATFETSPLAMPLLLTSAYPLVRDLPQKVVVVGNNEEASNLLDVYWSQGLPRHVSMLRLPLKNCSGKLAQYFSDWQNLAQDLKNKAAFVCTGEVCLEPTSDPERFLTELRQL
ncbi:Six-hairpin glycosidase-like protein [Gracilaria domingensis]|nr:Six-hairpin glycosidase-like protein [Gracilaria domingensis]